MPPFLSKDQQDSINAEHAAVIKGLMSKFIGGEFGGEMDHDPGEEHDDAPRSNSFGQAADRVGEMLTMRSDETRKFLPIEAIMKSADEQHNAVLQKEHYVAERSNRDAVLAQHIFKNVGEFIKEVPIRCKEFELLPEQRVAIMAMTNALPVETFTEVEISNESMANITRKGARKQAFKVKYNLEAGALPVFTLADYSTGAGKTVMAVMAALVLLCSPERWLEMRRNYKDLLRIRIRERDSGLCKGGSPETAKIARVAIIFAPMTIMNHWYKTAMSAVFGVREIFGGELDVVVWKGISAGNLRDAHESGKPHLWILPMESDSMRVVRAYPDIGYAVRIFDELNMRMAARYDQQESTPMFNYVVRPFFPLSLFPFVAFDCFVSHFLHVADPGDHRVPLQGDARTAASPSSPRARGGLRANVSC